jgi:plastocyanin
MKARITIIGLLAVAATGLLVLAACTSVGGASEDDLAALQDQVDALDGAPSIAPVERLIEVTGLEIKGTTNTEDLAVPEIDPETLSAGFGYDAPGFDEDNPTNWRVASYIWGPGNMTAFQGDSIDLHTFILNGNSHNVWVEAPDGSKVVEDIEMNRGRDYNLKFEATQAGVYKLVCSTHAPTMTADIVVLPTS